MVAIICEASVIHVSKVIGGDIGLPKTAPNNLESLSCSRCWSIDGLSREIQEILWDWVIFDLVQYWVDRIASTHISASKIKKMIDINYQVLI